MIAVGDKYLGVFSAKEREASTRTVASARDGRPLAVVVTEWADGSAPAAPVPATPDDERQADDDWNATPAAQHYDVWRVHVYREHHRVGAVEFMYEDDAIAFHAFVNGEPALTAPVPATPMADPYAVATVVDDGEVWVRPEGDGFRIGMATNADGDQVSHMLTADEARTLSAALAVPATPDDERQAVEPAMHIIRRADGEEIGEFAFFATDGPDGWDVAENADHDEDTVYEILACYPVTRRKFLWSTLCETCDGEGDGCPACAGSGECEPPEAERILAAPSATPVPRDETGGLSAEVCRRPENGGGGSVVYCPEALVDGSCPDHGRRRPVAATYNPGHPGLPPSMAPGHIPPLARPPAPPAAPPRDEPES
jgi:hypothetical protein